MTLSASQFHQLVANEMVNVFFLLVLDNTPYICRFLHSDATSLLCVQGKHMQAAPGFVSWIMCVSTVCNHNVKIPIFVFMAL